MLMQLSSNTGSGCMFGSTLSVGVDWSHPGCSRPLVQYVLQVPYVQYVQDTIHTLSTMYVRVNLCSPSSCECGHGETNLCFI